MIIGELKLGIPSAPTGGDVAGVGTGQAERFQVADERAVSRTRLAELTDLRNAQ